MPGSPFGHLRRRLRPMVHVWGTASLRRRRRQLCLNRIIPNSLQSRGFFRERRPAIVRGADDDWPKWRRQRQLILNRPSIAACRVVRYTGVKNTAVTVWHTRWCQRRFLLLPNYKSRLTVSCFVCVNIRTSTENSSLWEKLSFILNCQIATGHFFNV